MTDTVNSTTLECLRRETADNPTASVIWLHGLGADATDFEPLVPMLDIEASVRFIFPNAPVRPVTINGGMEMRAWYDIDPGAPLAGGADIKIPLLQFVPSSQRKSQLAYPANALLWLVFLKVASSRWNWA